jgi:hypothetical protein
MIIRAIKLINPDAEVVVRGEDSKVTNYNIDNCTFEWLNGTSEISIENIKAQLSNAENAEKQEKQNAIDKKASGKQKLKDLGLDDDEIQALMGV